MVYAIWYMNENGMWVLFQTFEQPLDADHAFQAIQRLRPVLRVRLVRQLINVLADTEDDSGV